MSCSLVPFAVDMEGSSHDVSIVNNKKYYYKYFNKSIMHVLQFISRFSCSLIILIENMLLIRAIEFCKKTQFTNPQYK